MLRELLTSSDISLCCSYSFWTSSWISSVHKIEGTVASQWNAYVLTEFFPSSLQLTKSYIQAGSLNTASLN